MGRKRPEPVAVIHGPETEQAGLELAKRVAGVHADMVSRYIQNMSCGTDQKLALFDAIIKSARDDLK